MNQYTVQEVANGFIVYRNRQSMNPGYSHDTRDTFVFECAEDVGEFISKYVQE